MFGTILIANRGEIACRIIRTCRRLGVASVAVYSDADREARHVRMADRAHLIGPAPARESYLRIEAVIEAAQASGAEAIHPGYGFLSENADFAQACAEAGVVFVGPPPAAIRAMGSKSLARRLMAEAGVPVVPGYDGEDQDPQRLRAEAEAIGYPVLIKASAGGGGKGMRVVAAPADFDAALAACRREAAASFGDDRVLLERYLQQPRHIEVQIFGDSHGNIVHLFERDCSVQRRHQKVVEEAPAPGLTEAGRAELGRAACAAARAVGYAGAGTVEFIVSRDGAYYFMEMNTRLQVEHPVTEMITGQDLVEWQLRVAAGQALPLAQTELTMRGHALEARIYAEDPDRDFLPSVGRLAHLAFPEDGPRVRVDAGVEGGDAITPHYDPMIAKLIVWGEDRDAARAGMLRALAATRIAGVAHNLGFLARLVANPAFAAAELDTELIERERARLFPPEEPPPARILALAALADLLREAATAKAGEDRDPFSPWRRMDGWRLASRLRRVLDYVAGGRPASVHAAYRGDDSFRLGLEGVDFNAHGKLGADGSLVAELSGVRLQAMVVADGPQRHVFLDGRHHWLAVAEADGEARAAMPEGGFAAPMPGRVIALLAEPGPVDQGAPLLVLEAMKMEHTIRAPADGVLKRFRCAVGDQVAAGAELFELEAAAR